ncbi:nucleotidyltransferase domain-containing protein [Methylopila sp. 73B]|uniref:nucleotidyltransferase domain-containing protein n=1 Tax=Methylopila sp. 73B TaxID=1120792 RepID=UPI00035DB562|nr:nucleotidyltransferase domain-containing protein [Methylopila sp. 73B]
MIEARRSIAIERAKDACEALSSLGVSALVFGSLVNHRFGPTSDVDLLIVKCPRELKYGIEGLVEDRLGGLPFDVIYLDEIPAEKLDRFVREAVDARELD